MKRGEDTKCIETGEEEIKPSLFADAMAAYVENPVDSSEELPDLTRKSTRIAGDGSSKSSKTAGDESTDQETVPLY